MTNRLISSTTSSLDPLVQAHLSDLRLGLLRLHKTLLDFERIAYEKFYGRVSSNSEFLKLVINHSWFDWLHRVSELVVQIDERLSADEPITVSDANALFTQTRTLLNPLNMETGNSFEKNYYNALQHSPDVVLAHAQVANILATDIQE